MIRRDLLARLGDRELLRELAARVAADRAHTAELLAYVAEVDARKLYLREAYHSMHAYCVGELRFSEDAAAKRIQAARVARSLPALFDAIADGRLHLSAVCLLAPHLTRANAGELIAAATHKRKREIELLLAERFPQPDAPTWIGPVPAPGAPPASAPDAMALSHKHAPGHVSLSEPELAGLARLGERSAADAPAQRDERAATNASAHLPSVVAAALTAAPGSATPGASAEASFELPGPVRFEPPARAVIAPLAPQRFKLQVTIGQPTHDLLRRAQALLGHQVPPGDVAQVLERALEMLVRVLERRKFASSDRPRAKPPRTKPGSRHVPASVKRAVRARDGDRCTFVSENGRRCNARADLEFDHVREFARGGEATVDGIRLRCRAHNQYAAEATFGAGFMHEKREEARQRRDGPRAMIRPPQESSTPIRRVTNGPVISGATDAHPTAATTGSAGHEGASP